MLAGQLRSYASGAMQLIDALVRANRDFDFMLLPTAGHTPDSNHYGVRRIWDYLVTHLQGNTPPAGFQLSCSAEFALAQINAGKA